MKYLYALPLVLLLLASCADEKKNENKEEPIDPAKTDWAFYKLSGKVKNLSERSYSYTDNTKGAFASETGMPDSDLQFDGRGMLSLEKKHNTAGLSEEITYKGKKNTVKAIQYINGQPGIITEYNRNKKGNLTAITRRDKSNAQIDRIEMKFEGKNMVEKTTYNNQNNAIDKNTYSYDKKGNMIGESVFMGTQSAKVRVQYEYDEKSHKISEVRYSADKLNEKTSFLYEGDNVVSKETTDGNSVLQYSEKYVFDKEGNVTGFLRYEKLSNSRLEEAYVYDANNNMVSFITTLNKQVTQKIVNKYDKNNNLISTVAIDGAGKVTNKRTYAYQYDSNNNWTKKIVTINDMPAFLVERTINYY